MMRKIRGVVKKTDMLRSIEIRYPFLTIPFLFIYINLL